MDTAAQESLFRWLVDAIFGGGFLYSLYKLRVERRLREARAESSEAEADKLRSEAHRSDIGAMTDVVRSVREQWATEREDWHTQHKCDEAEIKALKEKLDTQQKFINEIGRAGVRGRLLD